MTKKLFVLVFIVALSGCFSHGFHRGELRKELSQQTLVTDDDIKKVIDLKPQLQKPFKLGVLFKEPGRSGSYYWRYSNWDWDWRSEERDLIIKMSDKLKEKGIISECIYISSSIIEAGDIKSIRYGAAQHGVDAVLVISGTAEVDRYANVLSVLYIGLITTSFIPGTEIDSLFLSNAALWDVRNGFLYLSCESEGKGHITGPFASVKEKDAINKAKPKAIEDLVKQIENHLLEMAK